jgi:uncharacterized FlgJ-related protein
MLEPIEQDIQTVVFKLNTRLAYIRESIDKLQDSRSPHSQQQHALQLREELDAFSKEAQVYNQAPTPPSS